MYFLISCKSALEETLLVVMTIPLFSAWMKLAIVLDQMLLRAQLMLTTCMLESLMNFLLRLLFISMMTCLWEGPFMVILIFSLGLLFKLLMTF